MRGIIYCRVSSKEQIEGTSLETQERACRDFALAKGIEVVRVFVEEGESAKYIDRTALLQLLGFVRERDANIAVLIVWKLDRFARNVTDHFSIKALLLKQGVRVMSVTEPIDSNPEGQLMETILAGFAQFDNDVRAARAVNGMRQRISEGIFPWAPPYGYKAAPGRGGKKTRPDVPLQPIFGQIKDAWAMFLTGAYTQSEIARAMHLWGMRTKTGRMIRQEFVHEIFHNKFYAGVIVDPWSGAEVLGQHEALISIDDFDLTQAKLGRRKRRYGFGGRAKDFPLRGLVRCPQCEHFLTACFSTGRKKKYRYYLCRQRICSQYGKSITASSAEAEFIEWLSEMSAPQQSLNRLVDQVDALYAERRLGAAAAAKRARGVIAGIIREQDELVAMRSKSLIGDEEFTRCRLAMVERRAIAQRTLAESVPSPYDLARTIGAIAIPLAYLAKARQECSVSQRRRFDLILLPCGYTFGTIRTAKTGLTLALFQKFRLPEPAVVPLTYEESNQIIAEIKALYNILTGTTDEDDPPKPRVRNRRRKHTP